jgi:ATP-dependent DNA helicase RecG
VRTVADELYNVPRRYLDFSTTATVAGAQIGEDATVVVQVDEVAVKRPRPRMTVVEVSGFDETGVLVASYFNQPWLAGQFRRGQRVAFRGKVGFSYGFKRMNGPFHDLVSEAGESSGGHALLPVHRSTDGLSQQWARRIASCALEDFGEVCDFWPASVRAGEDLLPLARALRAAHFPRDLDEAEQARRRLAFDEAACLQVALAARRDADLPGVRPVAHVVDGPRAAQVAAAMPFALTADQARAVDEILADMARPRPMNRLLLGDVGTGKTAVATRVLAAVADTGTQAAMMAPTGVLAAQYAEKVGPILDAAGIAWALLTGATPAKERARILERLAAGELSVLFGTHALITGDVAYRHLSLAVIDEQQRFGVNQRHALREKGRGADLLVMSATPIPRTLALALYGDLDRSYLRERPVKGAGVTTEVIPKRSRGDAYEAIRAALGEGRQAYVICPLVGAPASKDADEPDEAAQALAGGADPSDPKAAEDEVEVLRDKVFRGHSVGLLTGRMRPDEKNRVMADFKAGAIEVLVSTTVVEVGVDVPNATVMLIEDGERFGLAQLHQLRGRVGRGKHPGHVFIACDAKSPNSEARMAALERTSDGFELAEEDLRLRREGDIMGRRQSGDAVLRFVDLARDLELVERAHEVVFGLMADDPELTSVYNAPLRAEVIRRYGDVFTEVGGG